jgi:lipopolysaccharide/colanic/teichoic acid biosynthesis glycosyltransferase
MEVTMADISDFLDQSIYSGVSNPKNAWLEKIDPNTALFRGDAYLIAKRVMDIALVIVTLPLVLPLCLLLSLLIKLESPDGPIIFVQNRTGKNGVRFKMYKFRTMVPNAEELKKQLAHLNELAWPDFKVTNDPRVTRIGHILRTTSLDELPQLFNILKGDMSLVGPRPTSFSAETYDLWHTERLEVLPGLTGLWQIMGRAETEFYERLRLDIAYIKHRCIWLDIQILFRTISAVISRRGAH